MYCREQNNSIELLESNEMKSIQVLSRRTSAGFNKHVMFVAILETKYLTFVYPIYNINSFTAKPVPEHMGLSSLFFHYLYRVLVHYSVPSL
jgi:hypothetical protein